MEITTGSRLPAQSINKLRNVVLMRKHATSRDETTAKLLLKILSRDLNISRICRTGSYDDTKDLVTVRKQRKSKKSKCASKIEALPNGDMKTHVKSVIMGLAIGKGEFLISVMWMHRDATHFHRLHPKIQGGHMKHRTNAERRSLCCLIFVDMLKKNCPGIHEHVPLEAEQVQIIA